MNLLDSIGKGSANTGERMEIKNENGESFSEDVESNPFLILLGKDSDSFRSEREKQDINGYLKRRDDEDYIKPLDEKSNDDIKLLSSCVIGWGNINNDDMPLDFNEENVKFLLQNSPILMDQIRVFITTRENFLGKSQTA
ncbi:MAG: hypothetical protein U9O83_01965 [Campylobacterota bacterium]|nr:hypothetical protein [Campylobacterota bacterium]